MKTISHTSKKAYSLLVAACLLLLAVSSCKKEETPVSAPVIEGLEIGTGNNKTAYPGHDLHLEAAVTAPGTIASVKLQITPAVSGQGWTYSNVFTKNYAGQKNAEFHEHLDVPADAKTGDYALLLIVTDNAGNRSEISGTFKVIKDPSLPTITGMQLGLNAGGSELAFTATTNAPGKIARLNVRVQSSAWTKEYEFTDADMVGQTSYLLDKTLDLSAAPKGHYHIHFKLTDQAAKEISYEYHFDKT